MIYVLALMIALAGSAATAATPAQAAKASEKGKATYIPASKVDGSVQNTIAARLAAGSEYSVMIARRTEPGQSELHENETDIFYIAEGAATFVTGGEIEGGKTTEPGEIRGAGIKNGETHQLRKGDVIVIPRQTPHWYKGVTGEVKYFIVKIRE